MFSGIGGFDLALNRQGHQCIGYSEINKYSIQTYKKNFGDEVKNYGDATKINPDELPDFDFLCGGFPCQAFSIAGKRRGFEDTRGTLFFEIARILKAKRPAYFLLENVKGLLNHDKGNTFATIIQTLDELGYEYQWMVLNSKFFGVPQNRERVFIIGNIRGKPRPEILPFRTDDQTVADIQGEQIYPTITGAIGRQGSSSEYKNSVCAIANTLTSRYEKSQATGSYLLNVNSMHKASQGMRVYGTERVSITLTGNAGGLGGKTGLYVIPVLTPNRTKKRQNGRRFKEDGDNSFTLTKTDIHGVSDGMKIRRLTPLECERLQSFPDFYTDGISDSQRYKQLGNAVTVNVIEEIIKKMI